MHIDTGRWSDTVVRDVDLCVPDGRLTALVGDSGCGKSILASALCGRLPGTATCTGDVDVDGTRVVDHRQWDGLRDGVIGYVPQDGVAAFDGDRAVGRQLRDLEQRYHRWSVDAACSAAAYPRDVEGNLPGENSGGEIKRAALAAAMLPGPSILLVDEPSSSLDLDNSCVVWKSLREYADTGAAVLVITHDIELLVETRSADRIVVMRAGAIIADGAADEVSTTADQYIEGLFRGVGR